MYPTTVTTTKIMNTAVDTVVVVIRVMVKDKATDSRKIAKLR